MELIRPMAPVPPSWWAGGGGRASLLQNAKLAPNHISVQRATPFQDLLSFASTVPINSRTSVEAMLQGTKIRLGEMRVKLMHKFPNAVDSGGGQDGFLGLTGATDLDRRHRVTLESTLGCRNFEISLVTCLTKTGTVFPLLSHPSWNPGYLGVVHKMGERNTFSPILSKVLGDQPQAGLSWTHQLSLSGRPGKNSVHVKFFWSGSGAYSVSIKAQAGELDGF